MNAKASNKRVVAAMSGGVDSSVAAALLKREGWEVIGVTLRLYLGAPERGRACCAGQDILDAKLVAEKLAIAHHVLDYEKRFSEQVIADFVEAYAGGLTPVPCVHCNSRIKFAALAEAALRLGAEVLATGHYVRRVEGAEGVELHCAADLSRDQSYFLFATTREQLDCLRFPLGSMTKPQVRAIAAELGLGVAAKPASQDICFVQNGRYADIVRAMKPEAMRPGEIVDRAGRMLGRHDGIVGFTVGQHKGLGLSGVGEALFVLELDAANARIVVGPREALRTRTIFLRQVNWLADPVEARECAVKVRSTRAPVRARVYAGEGGAARVELAVAEEAVAPGQACVFYQGTRMLGGGWIVGGERNLAAA